MMTSSFLKPVNFKLTAASYMTLILTLTGCQSLTMTKPATTSAITKPATSVAQTYNASVIKPESSQQTLKQHAWHIQHALAKQD